MGWFQGNFGLLNKLKEVNGNDYSYMMVSSVDSMAIRVVEFSNRGYKIRKVFA